MMRKVIATAPPPEPQGKDRAASFAADGRAFDVEAFFGRLPEEVGVGQEREFKQKDGGKGRKWPLDRCPFNPDHVNTSAAIFQYVSGAVGFRCLHDSCANNLWPQLRALCDPKYAERLRAGQAGPNGNYHVGNGHGLNGHTFNGNGYQNYHGQQQQQQQQGQVAGRVIKGMTHAQGRKTPRPDFLIQGHVTCGSYFTITASSGTGKTLYGGGVVASVSRASRSGAFTPSSSPPPSSSLRRALVSTGTA
jgi:hypothetical protein